MNAAKERVQVMVGMMVSLSTEEPAANWAQEMLIDWGYAICDAAIRRYFPQPNVIAPQSSPYGHFKQKTAVGGQ